MRSRCCLSLTIFSIATLAYVAGCGGPPGERPHPDGGSGSNDASVSCDPSADTDEDCIPDGIEGCQEMPPRDTDGDGAPELIASFGAATQERAQSLAGMVVACEVAASGQVTACTDLETTIAADDGLGPAVCVDAAAGIITDYQRGGSGPVPATELVMVCHRPTPKLTQVFRVAWDGSTYTSEPVLDVPNTVERIFLGDVTGDAVADLLALDVAPGALVPELRIYPQCTSRDTCEVTP